MSLDQRPPTVPLRRKIAQATKGVRLAMANGFARALGLKLQAFEPQRPATDRTPQPAKVAREAAPAPAPQTAAAPPVQPAPTPQPAPQPAPAPPKPAASERPDRFAPDPRFAIRVDDCSICGDPLNELVGGNYCPNCNSPARVRVLPALLDSAVKPAVADAGTVDLPLLAFAMAGVERELMEQIFPVITSVSLFGKYGKDHIEGVDARDLSRFPDRAFSGHFSILLFDYFVDHTAALKEAYRVLAPGGIFVTQMSADRLQDGWKSPEQVKEVRRRGDYFAYLPEGVALADVKLGRQWFCQAMQDAGFAVRWVRAHDRATAADLDWFVGYKPKA